MSEEKNRTTRRGALGVALGAVAAPLAAPMAALAADPSAADRAKAFAALPDWTGIWTRRGNLFDLSGGTPTAGANAKARDYPPYKPEWERAYSDFFTNVVLADKFSDPLTVGFPGGMFRMMTPARGLQFALRPEQVWIVYERPDVRYIYTDGRPFPPDDELWPTFEGYSIGHWEGDTLVVQTRSIKGGIPIDRSGMVLSDEATCLERIRKIDAKTLQSDITIEDPLAFTAPWKMVHRYIKRDEEYPRMENVSSLENQRNPLVNGETKVLLGDQTPDVSSPYPPDIRRFAVPNIRVSR